MASSLLINCSISTKNFSSSFSNSSQVQSKPKPSPPLTPSPPAPSSLESSLKPRKALASAILLNHPDIQSLKCLFWILAKSMALIMLSKMRLRSLQVGWVGVNFQVAHCRLQSQKFMLLSYIRIFRRSLKSYRVTFLRFAVWNHRTLRLSLIADIYLAILRKGEVAGFNVNPFNTIFKLLILEIGAIYLNIYTVYVTKLSSRMSGLNTPQPKHQSYMSTIYFRIDLSMSAVTFLKFLRKKSVLRMWIFLFVYSETNAIFLCSPFKPILQIQASHIQCNIISIYQQSLHSHNQPVLTSTPCPDSQSLAPQTYHRTPVSRRWAQDWQKLKDCWQSRIWFLLQTQFSGLTSIHASSLIGSFVGLASLEFDGLQYQ